MFCRTKLLLSLVAMGILLCILPGISYAATYHVVKPNDTLWGISQTYGLKVDELSKLNNLQSELIYPGQKLVVSNNIDDNNVAVDNNTAVELNPQPVLPPEDKSIAGQILNYAKIFIGTPYRSAGSSPVGFDCSGYTTYVYKQFNINLPRTSRDQYKFGKAVCAGEAKPGDLVAFASNGRVHHVGIYIGNNEFIHSSSKEGIVISKTNDPYWGPRLAGYRRVI